METCSILFFLTFHLDKVHGVPVDLRFTISKLTIDSRCVELLTRLLIEFTEIEKSSKISPGVDIVLYMLYNKKIENVHIIEKHVQWCHSENKRLSRAYIAHLGHNATKWQ